MPLDPDLVRRAPKVLLHDHLDGGLRPATVLELAAEVGHPLPAAEPAALGRWFADAANSGSLPAYLETFDHTVAVMQTAPALTRVAREFVEDMVADGVVYAETRWAPSQHTARGLALTDAVRAVQRGLDEGVAAATAERRPIRVGQLLTALRHQQDSPEIAELAGDLRHEGVVGFDLAGPEAGFPPVDHLTAIGRLKQLNMKITLHAGEAFGPASIWQAVQRCGADRVGHGVRLAEDVVDGPDGPRLGELGGYLRDARIALELCPSSNVQTGAVASVADHPIDLLTRLGLRTTLNTDNRLMSDTSLSREFLALHDAFGYGLPELRRLTLNAAKASFLDLDARRSLITEVILPGYAALGA